MKRTHSACRPAAWIKRGLLVLIALLLLLTPGSASSASLRLFNTPLQGEIPDVGTVSTIRLSPDGSRVVFTGDLEINGMSELYSTPTRGGPRTRLSGDHLINGGNVNSDFAIDPSNRFVVFRADKDVDGVVELYCVSIDGNSPIQLNQELVYNQDVDTFVISPDGQYVVYTIPTDGSVPVNIYSVPITGGVPVKINGDVGATGQAYGAQISPDSRWVVYFMRYPDQTVTHLYSAPITGPITGADRIRLNGDPVADAFGVSGFEIAPNAERVVYRAYQDRVDAGELYSVGIRGPTGSQIKLNPAFPSSRHAGIFKITPNSGKVVYQADQTTDNRIELYSAPIAGGASIQLTDMITFTHPDGKVQDDFQITANSLGVVFRVNPSYLNTHDLYAATLDGATWRKYNPTLTSSQTVSNFKIAPSDWGVVFRSSHSGIYQLYSVDMYATHALWPLTFASSDQFIDTAFRITPDSQYVVYPADLGPDSYVFELFSFPIRGTNPAAALQWNLPFHLPGSDVVSFIFHPDSSSLVFTADTEIDEQNRLFYAYYAYPGYLPLITR